MINMLYIVGDTGKGVYAASIGQAVAAVRAEGETVTYIKAVGTDNWINTVELDAWKLPRRYKDSCTLPNYNQAVTAHNKHGQSFKAWWDGDFFRPYAGCGLLIDVVAWEPID